MARDFGLEELMRERLSDIPNLTEKPLFGGLAWLLDGSLLCAARDDGALVRLGKGNDHSALEKDGVIPMVSRGRIMEGWIRIDPIVFAEQPFSTELIAAALRFVRSLPPKR